MLHCRPGTSWLTVLLLLCSSASADRVYQYRSTNGDILFTDKAHQAGDYHLLSVRQYDWSFDPRPVAATDRDQYDSLILLAAEKYTLDPGLIKAVIHAESHFNTFAVSRAGAQGLMQLMPATSQWLKVRNVFDSRENIFAGSQLLASLQRRFGNLDNVLAAYNAGAINVDRYNGIPPFPETRRYVKKVKELLPQYQQQFASLETKK